MAAPQHAFPNDELLRKFHPTGFSGAVVTVEDGNPTPQQVFVNQDGTVQFVNKDSTDYRLRLWIRSEEHHPDVGVLLSGRGGVTVIVDLEISGVGECYYELIPFKISTLGSEESTARTISSSTTTPHTLAEEFNTTTADEPTTPPQHPGGSEVKAAKGGRGPGGGIITVP